MSACQVTVEIILHTGQVTVEIILQPETQSEATTPVRKAISLLARLDPGQAARPPSVQVIQTMSLSVCLVPPQGGTCADDIHHGFWVWAYLSAFSQMRSGLSGSSRKDLQAVSSTRRPCVRDCCQAPRASTCVHSPAVQGLNSKDLAVHGPVPTDRLHSARARERVGPDPEKCCGIGESTRRYKMPGCCCRRSTGSTCSSATHTGVQTPCSNAHNGKA